MSIDILIGVLVAVLVTLGQKWLSDRTRSLLMSQLDGERQARELERLALEAKIECARKENVELRARVYALEQLCASKGATVAEIGRAEQEAKP